VYRNPTCHVMPVWPNKLPVMDSARAQEPKTETVLRQGSGSV
jgi:hypothetical protein